MIFHNWPIRIVRYRKRETQTDAPYTEGPHSVGVWTLKMLVLFHEFNLYYLLNNTDQQCGTLYYPMLINMYLFINLISVKHDHWVLMSFE